MIELPLQHEHHHDHDHEHSSHDNNEHEQESNLSEIPCHPHRPIASFDFSGIEEQIQAIKRKKQAARLAASLLKKPKKLPHEIYEADVIEEVLEQSLDMVPSYISVALKHRLKYIEDKVYIGAQNERQGEFVSRLKQQVLSNEALSNELNLVMDHVQISIENDIEEGSYDIHNIIRAQKRPPPEPEPAHRVKLKNMMIKSKLMDLKEEMSLSQIGNTEHIRGSGVGSEVNSSRVNKKQGEIWGDEFHLLSQGTRKAQSFIKKLQKEQIQQRKQRIRKNKQMQSLEVKSAMQHKQFEQQMRKEKHQSLKKRYEQTRQQKKALKAKQEMNEKEYRQFLKEYQGRKPLFRIKQEQYLQNVIEEQERKRKLQLMEIHDAKKPMSHEELLEHQRNYQKWKEQKQAQMLVQREFKKKEEAGLPRKSFYRGKFHSLIMQEKEERQKKAVDPLQAKQAMLKKQKQFAEQVRKRYAPLISQAKKKQLSQMMTALEKGKNEKALSEQQYRQLGNQYLKQVHKMIEQLRAKGLIKTQEKEQSKPKIKDYLKEVRDRYNFSTIDYNSQVDSNSQWVQNKALKHEKDARLKQKVLKFKSHGDFDFEKYMREVDNINNDYINSAEAKISLINKLERNNNQTASKQRSEVQSSKKSKAKESIAEEQSEI